MEGVAKKYIMKKKIIIKIIIFFYVTLCIFTTFSLLKYNNYNFTQLNNKILIKLKDNAGNYKKGSLLIVDNNKNYSLEDNIFYCQLKKGKCDIRYGKINTIINDDYVINNEIIPQKLLIGIDKKVISVPIIGYFMQILESEWGYLLLIVVPMLLGFIYEVYMIIKEIKSKKKTLEEDNGK